MMTAEKKIGTGYPGFTLLEILAVVILLGILAAVVVPMFVDQSDIAEKAAYIHSVQALASAIEMYRAANMGEYPNDVNPGIRPPGMTNYFSSSTWSEETPVGGQWDWENGVFGITGGVSVLGSGKPVSFWREIDTQFDDGNLGTGSIRMLGSDRYTYVLSD